MTITENGKNALLANAVTAIFVLLELSRDCRRLQHLREYRHESKKILKLFNFVYQIYPSLL